jgi:DNA-binding response OmpR family regulator
MEKAILIIDDDPELSEVTSDMLEAYGYRVMIAKSAEEAYSLLTGNKFHLILLDINLPGESGFGLCRELRRVSLIPIIFASARTSENDRVTGLDLGGDDYLLKPYSLKELLSRVNALYRRTYGFTEEEKIYRIGDIEVQTVSRTVRKNGAQVSLSLKEYDLLLYLLENINKAIPKEKLLREVWGIYNETELSTVAVHIRWLREKLESDPSKPVHIKTVWGIGYCLSDNEDERQGTR